MYAVGAPDTRRARAMIPLLNHENIEVKRNAALVLSIVGAPNSKHANALVLLLEHEDDVLLRANAALALCIVGVPNSKHASALIPLLEHEDARLRDSADLALDAVDPDRLCFPL